MEENRFHETEPMARMNQPNLFESGSQPDLFGEPVEPVYRPDPDAVRARLRRILADARSAETLSWEPTQLSLYREIFPEMTLWLPDEEAARFRREFDAELRRFGVE